MTFVPRKHGGPAGSPTFPGHTVTVWRPVPVGLKRMAPVAQVFQTSKAPLGAMLSGLAKQETANYFRAPKAWWPGQPRHAFQAHTVTVWKSVPLGLESMAPVAQVFQT
jgi:hypothetical protein